MLRQLLAWLLTLAACALVVFATNFGFGPASTRVEWRLFDVPPHSALPEIADKLQNLGIIRSKVCFLAAALLHGDSGHLQAGQYRLSPSMSPVDIVRRLSRGEVATEWVVIPEGTTVRGIEHILEKHDLTKPRKFESALKQSIKAYRDALDLAEPSLEGYLYPDTYKIPKSMAEVAIIRLMVERFRQIVERGLRDRIKKSPNGLSFYDTLILASLVEKEARHDEERAHIAGVLVNRLRNGTRLDFDAAIDYALPQHKARLTREDLQLDSPYNTYLHRGLPPTPICCPGLPSFEAALQPAATRDLYYVASTNGYHLFSQTLVEHNKNVYKVKQIRSDRGP